MKEWIEDVVGGINAGVALIDYDAPESTSARGMMSEAVRLRLNWGLEASARTNSPALPASVFYKRVESMNVCVCKHMHHDCRANITS